MKTIRTLRRERAEFVRLLLLPQTSFTYRQRLRKAIAVRDQAIEKRTNVYAVPVQRLV
jgi:hypothetical protein